MKILHNIQMILNLSCRHASMLLSRAQDAPLTRTERLAVRIHLLLCRSCRRFNRWLTLFRETLRTLTSRAQQGDTPVHPLSESERQRLLERLIRALGKKK